MYGEARSEAREITPTFRTLPGGVEQCPTLAVTRVPLAVACEAKRDVAGHLMLVVGIDRPEHERGADLLVYVKVRQGPEHLYVDVYDVKRMKGESPDKPVDFGVEEECQAEAEAARGLVSERALRNALVLV